MYFVVAITPDVVHVDIIWVMYIALYCSCSGLENLFCSVVNETLGAHAQRGLL